MLKNLDVIWDAELKNKVNLFQKKIFLSMFWRVTLKSFSVKNIFPKQTSFLNSASKITSVRKMLFILNFFDFF